MKRILKFLIALFYKIKFGSRCKINASSNTILGTCSFEGKNALGRGTYFSSSSLGYGSYIGNRSEFSRCKIGRFSSIGSNVRVVSADHPIGRSVSSHPAFYSDTYFFSYAKESHYKEHLTTENGYECEIGNDVWIGDNVLIKGGVTIGDGAVIGMGSVVTHDVPPYTVVAGVPAKKIRMKYDESTVELLMKIRWWDRPIEWIAEHAEEFCDVEKFVNHYDERSMDK